MGMPATTEAPITTIEALLALPDDGMRHELLDGEHVVTPAPAYPHRPRTLVQPDLFVIRVNPASPPSSWRDVGVPVVAIEVLSPGTASRDRGAKRRIYQRAGVSEYWIVDLDARLVERWTPSDVRPEILDERLVWAPDGGTSLLSLELASLFGPLPS